jgi:hypothetical protein
MISSSYSDRHQETENKNTNLTFKNRASYIYDGHTATIQMLHFIYFFFFLI